MLDEKCPTSDTVHVDEQFAKVVVVVDCVMEEQFLGDMIKCLRRVRGSQVNRPTTCSHRSSVGGTLRDLGPRPYHTRPSEYETHPSVPLVDLQHSLEEDVVGVLFTIHLKEALHFINKKIYLAPRPAKHVHKYEQIILHTDVIISSALWHRKS